MRCALTKSVLPADRCRAENVSAMSCRERDKMILAFALVLNEGNNATYDLETAANETERKEALSVIESAQYHSQRLRAAVLDHCQQHGC